MLSKTEEVQSYVIRLLETASTMSVGDLLTVPNMASRTGRRLSDALLQVVPNFPMSSHSPVSKLAKALAKHMDKKAAGQPVRQTKHFPILELQKTEIDDFAHHRICR